jgi:nucleoside-diphosphate kinase
VRQDEERTLVLLKPDSLQRGLAGAIISRLESHGLKLVAAKMLRMDEAMAHRHYEVHVGKGFFKGLVEFITSRPIVAMVWQGKGAVEQVRKAMGKTDPAEAAPGTIRGDWALDIERNLVHGSDSPETAKREISLFFSDAEIVDYSREVEPWVTGS